MANQKKNNNLNNSDRNSNDSEEVKKKLTANSLMETPTLISISKKIEELKNSFDATTEDLKNSIEEFKNHNPKFNQKPLSNSNEFNEDILLKNIHISSVFLDRDFNIKKITPSITNHFNLSVENIGNSIIHFSETLNGKEIANYSSEVIKTSQPFKKNIKNLVGMWFSMQIFPYRDQDDSIQGVVINFINIDESKKIEFQLKQSEERFRLAIAGTGSALWEWSDLNEDKAWWSSEIYDLLGYNHKQLKSSFSAFINILHPEQINLFRKGLENHVEKQIPFEEEILIKTNKEGYKWFRVNGQMQPDENNTVKKIVGTLLEIDERKKSETKLQELNVELERFAYLASHDLKEPLNTVKSFTSLLNEEYGSKFDENANMYMDFIKGATARMTTLTNDLLQYSQLDNKSLNFESNNLEALINEVKKDLQNTITTTNAEIIITNELPNIICDKIQIKQLLQNLISNSLKYRSDEKPFIEIDSTEKISYFEIKVKDNGIGIPKKYHTQIFEVFKRLHNQEEYEGTGIGLANCKRIIDNHGGRIWVRSKKENGAEFIFTIPKMNLNGKN